MNKSELKLIRDTALKHNTKSVIKLFDYIDMLEEKVKYQKEMLEFFKDEMKERTNNE